MNERRRIPRLLLMKLVRVFRFFASRFEFLDSWKWEMKRLFPIEFNRLVFRNSSRNQNVPKAWKPFHRALSANAANLHSFSSSKSSFFFTACPHRVRWHQNRMNLSSSILHSRLRFFMFASHGSEQLATNKPNILWTPRNLRTRVGHRANIVAVAVHIFPNAIQVKWQHPAHCLACWLPIDAIPNTITDICTPNICCGTRAECISKDERAVTECNAFMSFSQMVQTTIASGAGIKCLSFAHTPHELSTHEKWNQCHRWQQLRAP